MYVNLKKKKAKKISAKFLCFIPHSEGVPLTLKRKARRQEMS